MIERHFIRYTILRWGLFLLVLLLSYRLFELQILSDNFKDMAQGNVLRNIVQYPSRGEVYDRNGEFLVRSREVYDIVIIPADVKPFDTVVLSRILGVSVGEIRSEIQKARRYSMRKPSVMFKEMPKSAKLQLDERPIKGIYTQYRTTRSYPTRMAGNLLGYVGKVDSRIMQRDSYYRMDDYVGMSGIEQAYEGYLRGVKGNKVELVDVYGVPQGPYQDGEHDTPATVGSAIITTIDGGLQALAEELLVGKVGSVVAIEPATGEILLMASSPSYDPDLLVGRQRGNNYMDMVHDKRKPLFNRAVMASYPPGSTFKVINGLIGQQCGVLRPSDTYTCHGRYNVGRGVGCHAHTPTLDLVGATQNSCNSYFCYVYRDILDRGPHPTVKENYEYWKESVESFGFGRKLNSDFLGELAGIVRTSEYFDNLYKGWWNSLTVVSMAIGQGELGVTPLQMANLAAIVANRGHYYIPHVVKQIEGVEGIDPRFLERHNTLVDSVHFDPIVRGMYGAVHGEGGTARVAYIPGMEVCGKTGTAENPQGADHSTFMCFAPKDKPQIAISVYIEHGRFGATIAAPIATLLLEKYLTGEIKRQWLLDRVKNMEIKYPMYQ